MNTARQNQIIKNAIENGTGIGLASATACVQVGGTQTITGNKTFTGTLDMSSATVSQKLTTTFTNVDLGASGTAGSLDIFPTTAAKGKIAFSATDSTGDTTTTITNAAQSAACTLTIPDTNGSAEFVMTAAAQTIASVKTFTSGPVFQGDSGTKITWTLSSTALTESVTCLTGEHTKALTDNLANAWSIGITSGNTLLTFVTTDSAEALAVSARLTTTDAVASGTARVVGGRCTANVSAADSVTAAASNNAFVDHAQTYSIPADTLKAGSVLKCRAMVRVSDASGADTLTTKFVLGSTDLIATTAVDPGATTDLHIIEFEVTARAAPGASASCVGSGRWITNTGGTIAHGTGLLGATNFATNGALVLKVASKWSSNTASTACILESFTVEIV